jgi:hypothetical protein
MYLRTWAQPQRHRSRLLPIGHVALPDRQAVFLSERGASITSLALNQQRFSAHKKRKPVVPDHGRRLRRVGQGGKPAGPIGALGILVASFIVRLDVRVSQLLPPLRVGVRVSKRLFEGFVCSEITPRSACSLKFIQVNQALQGERAPVHDCHCQLVLHGFTVIGHECHERAVEARSAALTSRPNDVELLGPAW